MTTREIFISAGDESGDLHASNLMREMRRQGQDLRFVGIGRARMEEQGLETVRQESRPDGAMWLHNVVRLGGFRRLLKTCRRRLSDRPPDLVVLVDFGGFNLYVARAASRLDIPVLYYIPPQVWAHGAYRAKKLRKWVTRLAVVYPFEKEFYRKRSMEVDYVGHPLFDEIARHPPREETVAGLRDGAGEPLIGLFPGSRSQEVKANLGIAAEACSRIADASRGAGFAAVCPEDVRPLARELARRAAVEIDFPDATATELARAASLCITKSGTITLEIASQRCPMVIFYRVHPVPYFLASGLMQTPYIGLVNTLAGRMICPEQLMYRDDVSWVTENALTLLQDSPARETCRREIERVMDGFARPGASEKAARIALEMSE